MSDEYYNNFINERINDWREALAEVDSSDRLTTKQIERRIEQLEKKLEDRQKRGNKDQALNFEQLGVDKLYIDEFHEFRKLDFATNQGNIKGIDPNGSARAMDLFMKAQYLAEKNPGRYLTAASGTPITNTMGELYTVQRFFQPEQLREDGLENFDAWANQYGEITPGFEQNAAGGYEVVSRFAKFVNMPELMRRVRSFMDVLTSSHLGALVQRPDVDGGGRRVVVTPVPDGYKEYQQTLQNRINAIKARKGPPKKGDDIMLKVITDGRLSAIDMRFVDPLLPSDPKSKLNQTIDAMIAAYHATKDYEYFDKGTGKPDPVKGGAQILFSDLGLGEGVKQSRGFDMRGWMEKRLLDSGIPREHIAFMQDYKEHAKKERMFADMRDGKRRILIGGKEMETGTNVQKRLTHEFHLDAPWYPASMEQREGRIIRQGNQNKLVKIDGFATKGSYDATMWGMLARKARFIEQAMNGDDSVRNLEDVSEASAFEMAAALASGDERYLKLAGLKTDVERLERLRSAHFDDQNKMRRDANWYRQMNESYAQQINALADAIKQREPITAGNFSGEVAGKVYDNREEFSQALADEFKAYGDFNNAETKTLGHIGGFPITADGKEFENGYFAALHVGVPDGDQIFVYPIDPAASVSGLATKAVNQVMGLDKKVADLQQHVEQNNSRLKQIQGRLGAPFPEEQLLMEKVAELNALQHELTSEGTDAGAATEVAAGTQDTAAKYYQMEHGGLLVARHGDAYSFLPVAPRINDDDEAPAVRQSVQSVASAIANPAGVGPLNDVFQRLMQSGAVVVHPNMAAMPRHLQGGPGTLAVTDEKDIIHLIGNRMTEQNAVPVLLHEMFHAGVQNLIGTPAWVKLQKELGALYRQAQKSSGRARQFFDAGRARVESAKAQNGIAPGYTVEEFGAYTIEEYASAPPSFRKWVDDVIGTLKAWLLRRFGKQLGAVTPAQLTALAAAAVRAQANLDDSRLSDGTLRPSSVTPTESPAFKNWFGNSVVRDKDGKPLVMYHGTSADKDFNAFRVGKRGAWFTMWPETASEYSVENDNQKHVYNHENRRFEPVNTASRVIPAYLKIERPYNMTDADFRRVNVENYARAQAQFFDELRAKGYDGVQWTPSQWVVLRDPTQIKSAIGNNGDFDPAKKDMRRSFDQPGIPPSAELMGKVFDNPEDAYKAVGLTPDQVAQWKEAHTGIKQVRVPAVEQAAKDLNEGKIGQQQYLDTVRREQPIKPFKEVPPLPTVQEVASALSSDKVQSGIIGATKFIPDGTQVALRLDIPAYENHDTWVVSVHDGSVNGGKVLGYGQTAVADNVEFKTAPSGAMKIATGKSAKGTIARMFGTWVNMAPEAVHAEAVKLMHNPEWVQVGMNPFRHSWFYDKADGMPLLSADRVIQVGALVLAHNPVKVSPDDENFAIKGHPHNVRFSTAPGTTAPAGAGPQAQSLKPADMGTLRKVQASLQDNLNRVKQVQDEISKVTGIKDLGQADYYGAETNRPGRIAARLEDARERLTGPLMQKLAKAGYTIGELNELLHAQHAEERNEKIAAINPDFPDGGSGMTDAEAQAIQQKYANAPKLQSLADEARKIAALTLKLKKAYGLIDDATYDTLTNQYQKYVPLKGTGEYGPKIKRAMGHEARDEFVVQNIARDLDQAIVVGEKNLARQSLLQLVLRHPDPELWTASVPPQGRYVAGQTFTVMKGATPVAEFDSMAQANAYMEGVTGNTSNYTIQQGGETVKTFTKPLQDHEVMVYVKGQPIRLQINDEQLARQIRPLNQGQMHPILEFMRKMNRYFASIYTGKNPSFILRNMARDAGTGTINMLGNYGGVTAAKAWGNYPNAMATLGTWAASGHTLNTQMGQYLKEYRAQGGKIGASWMSDLEEQGKSLERYYEDAYGASRFAKDGRIGKAAWVASRKAVGHLAHAFEIGNQAAENALRLGLFAALRDQGESPAKAAQAAKNVTVNFDRKGTATGALGAVYLFFNPAVQGTANAIKTLVQGEHKYQAMAALGALAMLGFYAALSGLDDDKDRWLGYGWGVRSKNFIMRIGNHHLQVPMTQEFSPAYALGAILAEAHRGAMSPTSAAAHMVSSFMDAYFPLNGMYDADSNNHGLDAAIAATPTILKPGVELAANRNSFGQSIKPDSDSTKYEPDNLKMFRSTKNTAYDRTAQRIASLGELMGAGKYDNDITKVSPETLKFLWQTYTGGLGQFVADSAGLAGMAPHPEQIQTSDVPFVKDFVRQNDVKPIRARYYDLVQQAQQAIGAFKVARKAGDTDAAGAMQDDQQTGNLLSLGQMIRQTSKAAAAIKDQEVQVNGDDSLTPAQKRAQLQDLANQEEEIYREGIAAFQQ